LHSRIQSTIGIGTLAAMGKRWSTDMALNVYPITFFPLEIDYLLDYRNFGCATKLSRFTNHLHFLSVENTKNRVYLSSSRVQ